MQNEFIFPDQFNGYSRIEYLSVFISFLYALAISEFFVGWSRMVRNRSNLKFSTDHIIYTILFFWILIVNWYALWGRMPLLGSGFLYFILIIVPIALSYFAAVLMFPDLDKGADLQSYFDRNFKIIGINLSLFLLINTLVGIWIKEDILFLATIGRSVNAVLIFVVALFDLKKLRRVAAALMGLVLLIGSIRMAFI